jgi:hypothetical protein
MAGGSAANIAAPYPMGDIIPIRFQFEIIASKSADYVVDSFLVPWAFRPVYAELTAQIVTITNAITFNLEDDTGTPQVLIADHAVTAITGGAGTVQTPTLVKTFKVNAGARLIASYGSGAGDVALDVTVTLWVRPTTK